MAGTKHSAEAMGFFFSFPLFRFADGYLDFVQEKRSIIKKSVGERSATGEEVRMSA
jgi:hypothetical protein